MPFRHVLRSTLELSRSLVEHRRLLFDFVRRDLHSRYAGSSLGFFWSVIQPLANLAIYMFVFQVVLKARWADQMSSVEVSLMMFTGFLAWSSFAETLQRATTCVQSHANLIQKVVFPAEVLPTYLSISSLVSLLIGLPILFAAKTVYADVLDTYALTRAASVAVAIDRGHDPLVAVGPELTWGWALLCLPFLIVLQWVFATGVALLMSTLNVLVRDVQHLIGLLLTVWMFATPIFYPARLLRDAKTTLGPVHPSLALEINPMYWLIDSYQRVLLYAQWPQWHLLGRFVLVAFVVYALGARFLMREKRGFADLL
jgi:ABC-type polysaccharide/polyol phosphate export permease